MMIQTQFQTQIQVLRSDNARDYFNSTLGNYLSAHGIIHSSSCVHTPQQNGIAERKNRHLLEVARALMLTTNVPQYLWGEAIVTATYLINRMPSRVLTFQTPYHTFTQHFPHTRSTLLTFNQKPSDAQLLFIFILTTEVNLMLVHRSASLLVTHQPRKATNVFAHITNACMKP